MVQDFIHQQYVHVGVYMSAHLGFRHQVCHSRIQVLGFGVDGLGYRAIIYTYTYIYIHICDQRGSHETTWF